MDSAKHAEKLTFTSVLAPQPSRDTLVGVTTPLDGCRLPVELFRYIAEATEGNRRTLTTLLLVSRTLHAEAARCLYETLSANDTSRVKPYKSVLQTLFDSPETYARLVRHVDLVITVWNRPSDDSNKAWDMFSQVLPKMINLQNLVLHISLWDPLDVVGIFRGYTQHQDRLEWDGNNRHSDVIGLPATLRKVAERVFHHRMISGVEESPGVELPSIKRASGSAWLLNIVLPAFQVEELCYLPAANGELRPRTRESFKHLKRLSLQDSVVQRDYALDFIAQNAGYLNNLNKLALFINSSINDVDISAFRRLPRLKELVVFTVNYPFRRAAYKTWIEIEEGFKERARITCPGLEVVHVLPPPTPTYWNFLSTLEDTWWLHWPKVLFYDPSL